MVLASNRNRGIHGVDDPWNADGFYAARAFKARRKSGKSGKRMWRRILRKTEERHWRRENRCRRGRHRRAFSG